MKIQNFQKKKIKHNISSSAFIGGSPPGGIFATNTSAPTNGNGNGSSKYHTTLIYGMN